MFVGILKESEETDKGDCPGISLPIASHRITAKGLLPERVIDCPAVTGFGKNDSAFVVGVVTLEEHGKRFMYFQISLLKPTAMDAAPLPPGAFPMRIRTNF